MSALLLAHQGGWDEVLLVLVPIAVFAAVLAVANRRARAIESQRGTGPPGDGDLARPGDVPSTGPAPRRRDGPPA